MTEKLLKDNLDDVLIKAEILSNARKIKPNVLLATAPSKRKLHPSVIAQVAQELLDVEKIAASFVIAKNQMGNNIVSARSDGSINVQLIMEKLEGGGHFNAAAAQPKKYSFHQITEIIIKLL